MEFARNFMLDSGERAVNAATDANQRISRASKTSVAAGMDRAGMPEHGRLLWNDARC
jgi:hypothetical protein